MGSQRDWVISCCDVFVSVDWVISCCDVFVSVDWVISCRDVFISVCRGWLLLIVVYTIVSQLPPIAMAPYIANMITNNSPNVVCKFLLSVSFSLSVRLVFVFCWDICVAFSPALFPCSVSVCFILSFCVSLSVCFPLHLWC